MQQDSQPASQYDFILKSDQQPGKKRSLPMPDLPKPALIILGATVVLIIIALFYSLLFGGKASGTDQMIGILGRANEIARVSGIVAQNAQDSATQNLAATTQTAMSSDSSRLSTYIKGNKAKIEPTQLRLYVNKTSDAQIQTASQNNSLPTFYKSYLKDSLTAYANAIGATYKGAGPRAKVVLNDAFNNATTILSSAQVASTNP